MYRQVARNEVQLMRQLRGQQHTVQLVDAYEHVLEEGGRVTCTEVYLLMELCSGGSLADIMKQRSGRSLPEKQMWSMFLYASPSPPRHQRICHPLDCPRLFIPSHSTPLLPTETLCWGCRRCTRCRSP